jgi:hypothetical protein
MVGNQGIDLELVPITTCQTAKNTPRFRAKNQVALRVITAKTLPMRKTFFAE